MATNKTVPLVSYGKIVYNHVLCSFVSLERNIVCEKMIEKIMSKVNLQSEKSTQKKFFKFPETSVKKINSKTTTIDDGKNKYLDKNKFRNIEVKNTRSSKRCASLNIIANERIRNSVELSKEKPSSSSKRRKHRNSISTCESRKNETIAETKLLRSFPLVSKIKYSTKVDSSRSLCHFKEIEQTIVEDEPVNDAKQKFINIKDTTSNIYCEDLNTCNTIINKNNVAHMKLIKGKMSESSISEDELNTNYHVELNESTESNETEMLCYVLDSSTEDVNIEDEFSEPYNKTDVSVKNTSEDCAISVDKVCDEYSESVDICNNTPDHLSVECVKSLKLLEKKLKKIADLVSEESVNSAHNFSNDYDQSVIRKSENPTDNVSEESEKSVDHLVEENNIYADIVSEDSEKLVYQQIEEFDQSAVQLNDEQDQSMNLQSEEFEHSVAQQNEECVMDENNESRDSTDLLSEQCNQQVDQQREEYEESVVQLNDNDEKSFDLDLTKELDEVDQISEQSDEPADRKFIKTENRLSEEYKKSAQMREELSKKCKKSMVQRIKEYDNSVSQPRSDESMDQLLEDSDKSVEQISDASEKSPGYLNVQHLEEVEDDNSDLSVLCNNNNVTGFNIKTPEYNAEKISNINTYERNSFSPQDQIEDKANIDARRNSTVLNGLIESLYVNDNSKGEPIDLVTTGSSFDSNQLQTTIPPFKKRRTISGLSEISNQKYFVMESVISPINIETISTNNRAEDISQYFPSSMASNTSINNLMLSSIEKMNAEQSYLNYKQKFYNKNDFKTGLQYPLFCAGDVRLDSCLNKQVPRKVEVFSVTPSNNYKETVFDGSITKNTIGHPSNSSNSFPLQDHTSKKKKKFDVDTTNTTSMSNHPIVSINNFNSSFESNNFSTPGTSTESFESNRQINRNSTKTVIFPNYNREKKEPQHLLIPNTTSTQCTNSSEKYLPFKRRLTVRPRNSKTTRLLQGQPNMKQEISYPSKPMLSIANMCTCQPMNYVLCSLHPRTRNYEFNAPEYIPNPYVESSIKNKIVYQNYENNYLEKLNTESYNGLKNEVPDVAANEEVFDQSIAEFSADEPETQEFVEAYINYEETDVKLHKPKIKHSTKSITNQVTKSLTKSISKTITKSVTKPVTKPATKLTPYCFAMSPPNPPDSTTIPYSANKKRGRPRGR